MSSPIIYDSLLVHYLARELEGRLAARRLRRVRFDSEHRRFTLELDQERLVWELHPTRGWIRVLKDPTPDGDDGEVPQEAAEGWDSRTIRTQRRPRVRRINAPPDDRILEIEIDAGGPDRASRFVVELMTNQWNVLALAPDGRILSALWSREAGGRTLRTGEAYRAPGGFEPREGLETPVPLERWTELLSGVDPDDRPRAAVRSLAWTSPLNAEAIFSGRAGAGASEPGASPGLEAAWRRYRELASRPEPRPQVLDHRGGTPYPLPLPGLEGRPAMSLLAAFDQVSKTDVLAPEVREALEDRLERVTRRAERLREEAESAPEQAERLRGRADLLMARLHEIRKGMETVELAGFEGDTVTVKLDPSLSPVENAEALYDRARRRERAGERLPTRVRAAVAERNRIEALLEALDTGDADPQELARWVEELRPAPSDPGGDAERLPYRAFRSSGGLEIRVGRSGRANDDLTFHHSAPDDIWLHARNAAGAHVILRWDDRDQNPPRRDLLEAAVLAAVHSKARTSGTVPVDWTRRKYVRSPRKAPPGTVIPDRVSTVFVEPDPDVVERLSE